MTSDDELDNFARGLIEETARNTVFDKQPGSVPGNQLKIIVSRGFVERFKLALTRLIEAEKVEARIEEVKQDWLVLSDTCEMCMSNMDARNERLAQLTQVKEEKEEI